jgi:hypothetical protein
VPSLKWSSRPAEQQRPSPNPFTTGEVIKQRALRAILLLLVLLIVVTVITVGAVLKPKDYWPAVIACVLGGLLAVAELVARYRDDPAAAVFSWPAAVYVGVNATAGGVALDLIHVFGWTLGAKSSAREVLQVLTAGLGSAALFRSSLFNVTAGDRVIGIGPSEILNVILGAADRAVDRQRALIRATRAAVIMHDLPFDTSADAILAYCVATMQNVTPDEAREVEAKISALRDPKNDGVHDTVKSYILGLSLLSLVGDHVLTKATEQLREVLSPAQPSAAPPEPSPRPLASRAKAEHVLGVLHMTGGTMPLPELRAKVGLSLDDSYIINDLQQLGMISMEGDKGSETVRIIAPRRDAQVLAGAESGLAGPPGDH